MSRRRPAGCAGFCYLAREKTSGRDRNTCFWKALSNRLNTKTPVCNKPKAKGQQSETLARHNSLSPGGSSPPLTHQFQYQWGNEILKFKLNFYLNCLLFFYFFLISCFSLQHLVFFTVKKKKKKDSIIWSSEVFSISDFWPKFSPMNITYLHYIHFKHSKFRGKNWCPSAM